MVEKITLLEPHVEGAQFGPAFSGKDDEEERTSSEGRTWIPKLLLAGAIVIWVVWSLQRRGTFASEDSVDESADEDDFPLQLLRR